MILANVRRQLTRRDAGLEISDRVNTDDRDVERYLKLFTFLRLDQVAAAMAEHAKDRLGLPLVFPEQTTFKEFAIRVGRPAAEVEGWMGGTEPPDDDIIMKARGIAKERGIEIEDFRIDNAPARIAMPILPTSLLLRHHFETRVERRQVRGYDPAHDPERH